jgi:glycosyltransferase involved in cell wall biosynthesis
VFVREQARAVARHHDVVVLVVEAARNAGRPVALVDGFEDGVRVVRVRHRPLRGIPGGLLYVPAALLAARRLRQGGFAPDVVHGHVYAAGLLADILGAALRRPVVITEHFSAFQLGTLGAPARMVARAAFRGATVVAPVSERLRETLRPLAPRARYRVVPNVVDTALFHPPDRPPAHGRLLFVGLLDEVKGLPLALRALAALGRPGVGLDVVGSGPRRAEYEALAAGLRLQRQVAFHGVQEKPAIAGMMRAAGALVIPSVTETFSVVAIEAMASGLPVVATSVGALPELIDDRSGRLVGPGDVDDMARALAEVLDGRAAYDGAAIARRAHERYGVDAVARRWGVVYEEAVSLRRSRASAADARTL